MTSESFNWQEQWDPAVGLWWRHGAGHTPPTASLERTHPVPDAATRLLVAAQAGQLSQVDVCKVLTAIREAQTTGTGPFRGVPRWFFEEPYLSDSNAAFFTGMGLLVLWQAHREQLDEECRTLLHDIFSELAHWFRRALDEKAYYYPNKYLGDLVCGWLLAEILDAPDEEVAAWRAVMLEAATYWHEQHWGWGEHLSDIYARVILDQLSVLLLLSERLPTDVRAAYQELFDEMLAIEDAYADGPRIPTFRSYAFLRSPEFRHYRSRIAPLESDLGALITDAGNEAPVGATLHARGWHTLAPPPAPRKINVQVPCFDGVVGQAHVLEDIRLGSASRVPLMPSAEHIVWGMSWMCFPVAFWRPAGDWGFLQWATVEDGHDHSHPETILRSYVGQSLTQHVIPPVVGRTWALQRGGNVLALRIMPAIPRSWEMLCDRLRLVNGTTDMIAHAPTDPLAEVTLTTPGRAVHATAPIARWSQVELRYPERTLAVQCLPLTSDAAPAFASRFDNTHEWELSFAGEALRGRRALVTLWGITLDGPVTHPPVLTRGIDHLDVPRSLEERLWRLTWEWPETTWDVLIDPLSKMSLQEQV